MHVRITAGKHKGLLLVTPAGHKTHPMSEKLRSVIFNVLGDVEGLQALDAFAGSGAVGLEAYSRGAKEVTFIENDKKAQTAIEANIKTAGSDATKLVKAPVYAWSENNSTQRFDLIFVDPPFTDIPLKTISRLVTHVKNSGVLVLNYPSELPVPEIEGLRKVKVKHHGNATLVFYKV